MEIEEDIVIVGAGISGLSTALGLHRLGIRSVVLESSDCLRITGFALTLWTNAWRALDDLGIGDSLRQHSLPMNGFHIASSVANSAGPSTSNQSLDELFHKFHNSEARCLKRKQLLETLEKELPQGSIRYSSRVAVIEKSGNFKLVHLSDGSTLKTKVLIGCDGVNSVVSKWLGFKPPVSSGRSAIRGIVEFPDGHGFHPKVYVYFDSGVRYGFLPCDEKYLYWFCTFSPSECQYDETEVNPVKMRQLVLSKLENAPKEMLAVVERTHLDHISCASLKFRLPWQLLLGNIARDNVCVAGDALHPMTPDIGQGGCSALEDGVVLVRCLAEALSQKPKTGDEEEELGWIKMGLAKYAKERRWRSFSLISTAYLVGFIQQSDRKLISFLRRRFLAKYTVECFLRMADFDYGRLITT